MPGTLSVVERVATKPKQLLISEVPLSSTVFDRQPDSGTAPLLARWAVSGVVPVASIDMRNPDTGTWRGDTEDTDT